MSRKLPRMRAIESAHGKEIETLIADLLPEYGLVETGRRLGDYPGGKAVDKQTICNWMTRLGLLQVVVVLRPGEHIEIKRAEARRV